MVTVPRGTARGRRVQAGLRRVSSAGVRVTYGRGALRSSASRAEALGTRSEIARLGMVATAVAATTIGVEVAMIAAVEGEAGLGVEARARADRVATSVAFLVRRVEARVAVALAVAAVAGGGATSMACLAVANSTSS
jgi:hypothetical protein